MKLTAFLFIITIILNPIHSWEYCQSDIQNKLCSNGQNHLICDNSQNSITNPTFKANEFLAHVPLTRKVKTAFINWHNYYRNRTAGGWTKNIERNIYFPKAVRMRELIWDSELSYLAHVRTKLVNKGEVKCLATQRFKKVGQNLVVKTFNEPKPVLEIIALALREMFDEKNYIENPAEMPKEYLEEYEIAKQFATMVSDAVSRLGCAIALGDSCLNNVGLSFKYCYYVSCSYDYSTGGIIYKIGKPTGRCSRWGVGKSETYINLCANSGEIFEI